MNHRPYRFDVCMWNYAFWFLLLSSCTWVYIWPFISPSTNGIFIHLVIFWWLAFPSRRSNRWKSIINKHQPHTTATRTTKTTKHLCLCESQPITFTLSSYLFSGRARFNSSTNDEKKKKKKNDWWRKANVLKFIWKGCSFCSFQLALKMKAICLNLYWCERKHDYRSASVRSGDHPNCQTKQNTKTKISHDGTPHTEFIVNLNATEKEERSECNNFDRLILVQWWFILFFSYFFCLFTSLAASCLFRSCFTFRRDLFFLCLSTSHFRLTNHTKFHLTSHWYFQFQSASGFRFRVAFKYAVSNQLIWYNSII